MLNIVIPAAGRGRRFVERGYLVPKPFLPVDGKPMIARVMENVTPQQEHRFIILALVEHMRWMLEVPKTTIIPVPGVTEGAARTVLLAKHLYQDGPLLIVNSDQLIDWDVDDFLATPNARIATFRSDSPAYSYVRTAPNGRVIEVAEKRVISNEATVGAYYWERGSDFVRAAERMIAANDRTNGEFYVSPSFNYYGGLITTYPVARIHALGTPEDYEAYASTQAA